MGFSLPCLVVRCLIFSCRHAGRWPKHAEAYRRTKAALGLQLAEELAGSFGTCCAASQDFVDAFAGGFAFRLHLHSTRSAIVVCD